MISDTPGARLLPLFLALGVSILTPRPAAAQEPAVETLVPGRQAIAFRALDGTSSFGFWRVRDERSSLGLLVDARIDYDRQTNEGDDNDSSTLRVSAGIGPELRRYAHFSGRVAPYGFVGLRTGVDWMRLSGEPADPRYGWRLDLGGSVGAGAEFFPVRSFSLNVQTGLGSTLFYNPIDRPGSSPDGANFGFEVATFTTSIGGAIYF